MSSPLFNSSGGDPSDLEPIFDDAVRRFRRTVFANLAATDPAAPDFVEQVEAAYLSAVPELTDAFRTAAVGTGGLIPFFVFDETRGLPITDLGRIRQSAILELVNDVRDWRAFVAFEAAERQLSVPAERTLLRRMLGLHSTQIPQVQRFRDLLENQSTEAVRRRVSSADAERIRRAAAGGRPLSPRTIDQMVRRHARNLAAARVANVADLHVNRAIHSGADAALAQALGDGDVSPDQIQRQWVTRGDDVVRPSHRAIIRTPQPIGVPFRTGNGNLLRFPGDPAAPLDDTMGCRCVLRTTITGI